MLVEQIWTTARELGFAGGRVLEPGCGSGNFIGNVPFAKVPLEDPQHNRAHHSMHNHFLIKSLRLTRPGGLVTAITSRFTLDAQNPAARKEIGELADWWEQSDYRAAPCKGRPAPRR
jgi:hypothetical protein